MKRVVIFQIAAAVALTSCLADSAGAQSKSPPAVVAFDVVRPIFRKHCVTCHSQDRARGGLDLSSLDGLKAGSTSGPVAVAQKPDESLIYTLAAHLETPSMPPNAAKIPQRELDLIRQWIEGGLAERSDKSSQLPAPVVAKPAKVDSTPAAAAAAIGAPRPAAVANGAGVLVSPLPRATAVTALAASPRAPLVAVSGLKQVVLFQLPDGKPITALPFPEGDVFVLRFSSDGEVLLAGGGVGGLSGKVVGFDVATGKRLFEIGDEIDVVLAADISPDRSLVALGGPGRSVKVFHTADGELSATLRKHTDWILSLSFSPDGLLLASGDRFGGLQVWEAKSGKEFHTLRGHTGAVNAVGWLDDSDRLWSAGEDGTLRSWDMHEGAAMAKWDAGVQGVLSAASVGKGRLVCGGRGRKIAVWENEESRLRELSMADEVVELTVSHDGSQIVAGDAAGNIAIAALAHEEQVIRLALPLAPAPLKPTIARAAPPRTAPMRPLPTHPSRPDADAADAEAEARQAAADLTEAREAQAAAQAAVLATEESLKRLREVASRMTAVVAGREAASKQAAARAATLRARASARESADAGGPTDLRGEQERLRLRLQEKRSLLESAKEVAARIEKLASESPRDTGLQSAAKLAAQLLNSLNQDTEATADELRVVESGLQKEGEVGVRGDGTVTPTTFNHPGRRLT